VRLLSVIGSGIMGSGIAQVAATQGFSVMLDDAEESQLKKGIQNIDTHLAKDVGKGKLTEREYETIKIKSRIKGTKDLKKAVEDADVIIETIIERAEDKKN
jgi:3-hydroxyacyl-CoA dehydrogenase